MAIVLSKPPPRSTDWLGGNSMDEYQEWEKLRYEVAEAKEHAAKGGLWDRFWSWVLLQIEDEQKDIIDERYKR